MGISALNSHSAGKKHKELQESRDSNSTVFFQTAKQVSSSQSSQSMSIKTVESIIVPASALRAEILWTLNVQAVKRIGWEKMTKKKREKLVKK